jgi:hypothetical protein
MSTAALLTLVAAEKRFGSSSYGQDFAEWSGVPTNYSDVFVRLAVQFRPEVERLLQQHEHIMFVSGGSMTGIVVRFPMKRVVVQVPARPPVVIFDAVFEGKSLSLCPGMFHPCLFFAGRAIIADFTDVVRSFALARFYQLEQSNAMLKTAPALVNLPSVPERKVVDAGTLVASGVLADPRATITRPSVATDISWLPGKGQILAHNLPYLSFKDPVSEEVLRYFSGGRYILHTGYLDLKRVEEWKFASGQTGFRARL